MPIVWGFAASLKALAAAAAAFLTSTYVQVALIAYGVHSARQTAKKRRAAYEASITDRTITLRSSEAPFQEIFGQTWISGPLLYACTSGELRDEASMVVAVASHEVTAFDEFAIAGEPVGPLDGNGFVTEGSRYYRRTEDIQAQFVQGLPAAGGTFELKHEPAVIETFSAWKEIVSEAQTEDRRELVEGDDFTVSGTTVTMVADIGTYRAIVTYRTADDLALVKFRAFLGSAAGERDEELEADSTATGLILEEDDLPAASGNVTFPRAVQSIDSFKVGSTELVQGVDFGFTSGATTLEMFTSIYQGEKGGVSFTAAGGNWLPTDLGKEIARFKMKAEYNDQAFATGINDVAARVRGRKLYDPRTGLTEYSRNPALAIDTWVKNQPKLAGIVLNEQSVIEAANVCDEPIPLNAAGTETHPRYTLDGVVYDDQAPWVTLQAMLSAMNGFCFKSGGEWYLRAGAWREPVMDLYDEDMVEGPIVVEVDLEKSERFNCVRGQFSDPENLNLPNDYPPYESAVYIAQDGGLKVYDGIDLPFTDDPIRAQRIAKQMLHQVRQGLTEQASWCMKAYPLQAGDVVRRYSSINGWDGKLFQVVARAFDFATFRVRLQLRETGQAIFDWSYDEATDPDPAPNSNLPDPGYVEPPIGLVVETSANSFETLPDLTVVPYAIVSFEPVRDSSVLQGGKTVIKWKRSNESEWRTVEIRGGQTADSPRAKLEPISGGDVLNVLVYNVNAGGIESEKRFATHQAHPDLPASGAAGRTATNYLLNSAMAFALEDWRPSPENQFPPYGVKSTTLLPATPDRTNQVVSPEVSGYVNPQPGETGNFEIWAPNDVPVIAGRWLVAATKFLADRFNVAMRVRFLDEAGNYIASYQGDTLLKDDVIGSSLDDKSKYRQASVVAQVPEGAIIARWSVWLEANNESLVARSTFYWTEPQCNVLIERPNAGLLPRYQDGPTGSIGGVQLVDGAVTHVATKYIDEIEVYTPSQTQLVLLGSVAAESDVANANGVIRVTGVYDINFPGAQGDVLVIITEQSLTSWPPQPADKVVGANISDQIPRAKNSFVMERRFTMGAGRKTFLVYACAGGQPIDGGSCKLHGVTLSAEVIKK